MQQTTPGKTGGNAHPRRGAAGAPALSTRMIIGSDRIIYRVARRWLLFVNSLLIAHLLSVVLAPVFIARGYQSIANPIYAFNGLFCPQRVDRSFSIFGEKLAVCQRCAAIYASILLFGLVFALLRGRVRPPLLYEAVLLALPALIDGGAQGIGLWDSTASSRVLSGLFLGTAICWVALPFLESGFQRIRAQIEQLFSRLVIEGRARPL